MPPHPNPTPPLGWAGVGLGWGGESILKVSGTQVVYQVATPSTTLEAVAAETASDQDSGFHFPTSPLSRRFCLLCLNTGSCPGLQRSWRVA